jgi:hypothetical protein
MLHILSQIDLTPPPTAGLVFYGCWGREGGAFFAACGERPKTASHLNQKSPNLLKYQFFKQRTEKPAL